MDISDRSQEINATLSTVESSVNPVKRRELYFLGHLIKLPPPPSSEIPDRAERSHRVSRGKRSYPTKYHKETRRRRKKTILENQRAERTKLKPQKTRRIVTWNRQSISTTDQNRNRLRRAVELARQQKWKAVLISEIRSEQEGITWLGDKPNQAVVIHSEKCGVLLKQQGLRRYFGRVDSQRTTEKFLRAGHSGADRQDPPHRELSASVK